MTSSTSSRKHVVKTSFKPVSPFELFYQLTYMSALAASNITRIHLFTQAATTNTTAATYFIAVNRLVVEFRLDYPDACRRVGLQAKSENMRSFLLRLSDALRSGEPLGEFLAREAHAQGEDYHNRYERDLEALKQWTNAFSSIVISVALIVIIQVISSMIYSTDIRVISGLVTTGVVMSGFAAWIIWRSAPQEIMTVNPREGSQKQRQAMRLFRTLIPVTMATGSVLYLLGIAPGIVLIIVSLLMLPIGVVSLRSDQEVTKKDEEFATFLRSTGGMATSSGTTLKQALNKLELSSFPHLEKDIQRLRHRLQALVEPEVCWHQFGMESGSRLISEVSDIFYNAVKMGGDPERVGHLCSLFAARTAQLRAKRRLTAGTFSGLTTVMQTVVAGLMIFVLSVVNNFAQLVANLVPEGEGAETQMSLGMAEFSPAELSFLTMITISMIVMLAIMGALAVILADGGIKLKGTFYLTITMFISGISMIVVPPMVDRILTI